MKTKVCTAVAAVLIAWALKRHYADARANDLWWILAPTAQLVEVIIGAPFTLQPGEGYFSRERLFLIEKSCAGINFMVAAFAMLMFALFHRAGSGLSAARVLAASLVASYAAAVAINAVRIAIAMWLAVHPAALTTLSAAAVHRIEGITVYFGGMVLLYELAQWLDRRAFAVRVRVAGARPAQAAR
jgi:exosortase K